MKQSAKELALTGLMCNVHLIAVWIHTMLEKILKLNLMGFEMIVFLVLILLIVIYGSNSH